MSKTPAFEPVDLAVSFDETELHNGVEPYLARTEGAVDGVLDGIRKRVVWAGEAETKTPISVVYIHGFSATSEEIRPVPDRVAEELGANLYFTRLKGHGQGGSAMSTAAARDWVHDTAEAMAIGRAIGERVLVISVSTGGTLSAVAAADTEMSEQVAGMAFVAPNFGVKHPVAALLTWPWSRVWGPRLFGKTTGFIPANEGHETYWTAQYDSVAVLPMLALVRRVLRLDFASIRIPALFYFSPDDRIVRPKRTERVARLWGGKKTVERISGSTVDDPDNHVIAGDIMSPSNTEHCIKSILKWAETLDLKR
ncbi:alpha/beta hydrolase [Halocynthiibacter sp. C4]|uniref:alpha/beta hydrolase n=1 Tax=Halocynthiibacter sp. C4 TaxID=2992758 RepID=UPI00237A1B96|nr:alpha/beta fold hydrolase [Halocynthiibacter sp. C4]MDE0590161.1 alpha/beta hydrolase [Halocynthiibacter sp. C4]